MNHVFVNQRYFLMHFLSKIDTFALQNKLPSQMVQHLIDLFKEENSGYKFMRFCYENERLYHVVKNDDYNLVKLYLFKR